MIEKIILTNTEHLKKEIGNSIGGLFKSKSTLQSP